ncbi:helix-hairpin-helix domain-containing protein [Kurthia sibirica]|nr:helix-hairpin-helix domain-containing protein [Kurthia sibirica]GEK33313.1 competence protein [Kurthia sibirica]
MPSFILLYKKQLAIGAALILAIALAIFYYMVDSKRVDATLQLQKSPSNHSLPLTSANQTNHKKAPPAIKEAVILVDVKGAIMYPGVYKLEADGRVIEAIQLAGGYKKNAQSKYINHAQKVSDEMIIYVPRKGEKQPDFIGQQNVSLPNDGEAKKLTVNINSADHIALQTLNGIGPAKAQAIIDYRETNGHYTVTEDLMKVSGIGEKTFEKLRDVISTQ